MHARLLLLPREQAGFVAVIDAKTMKVMKKLVKEGFVLEAAVTPYSTNCQYVVTGGMQNVINVYDTAQGDGIPGTQFNKQEYALKETKSFTDDDPKCDFASHAGYISGLEFIEGGSKLVSYADTHTPARERASPPFLFCSHSHTPHCASPLPITQLLGRRHGQALGL